jgi:hypothetical protein
LPQSVDDFLQESIRFIDSRNVDPFTNNPETKATLDMLGYSIRAMLQEIKELDRNNLFRGPTPDNSLRHTGEVWEFKKVVQGHLIYIKLKIRNFSNGRKDLFVMSFHPDRP